MNDNIEISESPYLNYEIDASNFKDYFTKNNEGVRNNYELYFFGFNKGSQKYFLAYTCPVILNIPIEITDSYIKFNNPGWPDSGKRLEFDNMAEFSKYLNDHNLTAVSKSRLIWPDDNLNPTLMSDFKSPNGAYHGNIDSDIARNILLNVPHENSSSELYIFRYSKRKRDYYISLTHRDFCIKELDVVDMSIQEYDDLIKNTFPHNRYIPIYSCYGKVIEKLKNLNRSFKPNLDSAVKQKDMEHAELGKIVNYYSPKNIHNNGQLLFQVYPILFSYAYDNDNFHFIKLPDRPVEATIVLDFDPDLVKYIFSILIKKELPDLPKFITKENVEYSALEQLYNIMKYLNLDLNLYNEYLDEIHTIINSKEYNDMKQEYGLNTISQSGGYMNNNFYKEYMKYKKEYLHLRNKEKYGL